MSQLSFFPDNEQRYLPRVDVKDYALPTSFPRIRDAKQISLDFETHDPTIGKLGPGVRRDGYIVGAGISVDGFAEYYPMRHADWPNCDPDKVTEWLRDELKHFTGELVGANVILYDGDYAQASNIRPTKAKWRDVQWAEALLDETADSYGLDALAKKYLGETKYTDDLVKIYGEDVKKHFREVHPAHARAYTLQDLRMPPLILAKQREALRKEQLEELFELECRQAPLLLYLREKGVRVDLNKAAGLERELSDKYQEALNKMYKTVGFPVDAFSGQQLAKAFDSLHLTYPLTEKENPSFKGPWLSKHPHPFAQLVHEAREYEKIRGTFIQGYIFDSNIKGRIHCQFHPLRRADDEGERGTVSGRYSSTDPNLQNIPVRTDLGKRIRELFLPEEGSLWWARDYSQIEYRMLVHYAVRTGCAQADVAQKMYRNDPNTDFHEAVAKLTGLKRKDAKNLNFGLVYGMGKPKLAATLGLTNPDGSPNEEAEKIMQTYHNRAPFIKELYNLASKRAQEFGFVRTILKRRSRFNLWEPRYTERGEHPQAFPYEQAVDAYGDVKRSQTHKALNRVLQGSAADLIKKAMVNLWESGLIYDGGPLQMALTVHDEIDGSVLPGEAGERALRQVEEIMDNAIPLQVPVVTTGSVGNNWAEAK